MLAMAWLAVPSVASAQQWLADGVVTLGSGAEGADTGNGSLEWQRARLRVTAGIDLMNDEQIAHSWGLRGIAELEKSALVGAEARYTRWLGANFGGYISATAMIAPKTLVGMGIGANLIIPMGKRFGIVIDGSFSALPLGTDRANDGVVLWALAGAGVRLRF